MHLKPAVCAENLVMNISVKDQAIDKWASALSTAVPSAFPEKNR